MMNTLIAKDLIVRWSLNYLFEKIDQTVWNLFLSAQICLFIELSGCNFLTETGQALRYPYQELWFEHIMYAVSDVHWRKT